MNFKTLRNVHLYLGCFFAPLLIFFIVTGCLQTLGLHEEHKSESNYKPPAIIKVLSEVHKDQRWVDDHLRPEPSQPFRYLVLLMGLGLSVTMALGILMALKFTQPWLVGVCLFLGTVVPCFLLWMARGFK